MALLRFEYDNFNDNVIDLGRWSPATGSTLQTETGGRLNTPCAASSAPTNMRTSRNWFDIRKGRLAIRLQKTGTTDANVYTYFGIRDVLNNSFFLFGKSTDASLTIAVNGLGAGTTTNVDVTVGVGPSWVANTWLGFSFNEGTKTLTLAKSTDGVNWTDIFRHAVTGTVGPFLPQHAGLMLGCTSYGTVTNFTPSWDEASYFVDDSERDNRVRYNGAWDTALPKVRVNGTWKPCITKVRSGGWWVRPN